MNTNILKKIKVKRKKNEKILRSNNNYDFISLSIINNTYKRLFLDNNIYSDYYYKLKFIDNDGEVKYSKSIFIKNGSSDKSVKEIKFYDIYGRYVPYNSISEGIYMKYDGVKYQKVFIY